MVGEPVVCHQPLIAVLQVPCHEIQLLVHLGMLFVHLTQELHLLAQVLLQEIGFV